MRKNQWLTAAVAFFLLLSLYFFGKTTEVKKPVATKAAAGHSANDGHNHAAENVELTIDSVFKLAKKQLTSNQLERIAILEFAYKNNSDKSNQQTLLHRLSHFWIDSAKVFEPYAWYEAESSRLENSEKSLTFAAHLFLESLLQEDNIGLRQWKAEQAKDLFEKSLIINPRNDSSKVGLGACYLFGNISNAPMEGIQKIREVADRDSANVFAQSMLARGAVYSGQYLKAVERLKTIHRVDPKNMDAILMLADVFERMGNKADAIEWYQKSLKLLTKENVKTEILNRIEELKR